MPDNTEDLLREAGVKVSPEDDTPPRAHAQARRERAKERAKPTEDPEPDALRFGAAKMTPKWVALRESLTSLYTGASMIAFAFGDPVTTELIQVNSENCVNAWVDLAQKDKRVEQLLMKLTTGSAWGGVVMAHAPIALALMARKGVLPGGALFGAFNNSEDETPQPTPDYYGVPDEGIVSANGNGENGV
jgi:hypothetical protein